MSITLHSAGQVVQYLTPLEDEFDFIENGLCTVDKVEATLDDFGKVTFLEAVSDIMIILSSPASDLYIGSHTGILTYYDKDANVLHTQDFNVVITTSAADPSNCVNGARQVLGPRAHDKGKAGWAWS